MEKVEETTNEIIESSDFIYFEKGGSVHFSIFEDGTHIISISKGGIAFMLHLRPSDFEKWSKGMVDLRRIE